MYEIALISYYILLYIVKYKFKILKYRVMSKSIKYLGSLSTTQPIFTSQQLHSCNSKNMNKSKSKYNIPHSPLLVDRSPFKQITKCGQNNNNTNTNANNNNKHTFLKKNSRQFLASLKSINTSKQKSNNKQIISLDKLKNQSMSLNRSNSQYNDMRIKQYHPQTARAIHKTMVNNNNNNTNNNINSNSSNCNINMRQSDKISNQSSIVQNNNNIYKRTITQSQILNPPNFDFESINNNIRNGLKFHTFYPYSQQNSSQIIPNQFIINPTNSQFESNQISNHQLQSNKLTQSISWLPQNRIQICPQLYKLYRTQHIVGQLNYQTCMIRTYSKGRKQIKYKDGSIQVYYNGNNQIQLICWSNGDFKLRENDKISYWSQQAMELDQYYVN